MKFKYPTPSNFKYLKLPTYPDCHLIGQKTIPNLKIYTCRNPKTPMKIFPFRGGTPVPILPGLEEVGKISLPTLIPISFGATNFRTKKCPKVCNAENINFFRLVRKVITPKLLEKYFLSNFVLQALIGMKTIFLTL